MSYSPFNNWQRTFLSPLCIKSVKIKSSTYSVKSLSETTLNRPIDGRVCSSVCKDSFFSLDSSFCRNVVVVCPPFWSFWVLSSFSCLPQSVWICFFSPRACLSASEVLFARISVDSPHSFNMHLLVDDHFFGFVESKVKRVVSFLFSSAV